VDAVGLCAARGDPTRKALNAIACIDLSAPCAAARSTVSVAEGLDRVAVGSVHDERTVDAVTEPADRVGKAPVSALRAQGPHAELAGLCHQGARFALPSTPFPSKKDVDLSPKVPV
jgi:hypothetical protein